MTRRRALALVAALAVLAPACGSDEGPDLNRRAARDLQEQVDLVEFAISAGEYDAAQRGLDNIRQDVTRYSLADKISDDRVPIILVALDGLEQALAEAPTSG